MTELMASPPPQDPAAPPIQVVGIGLDGAAGLVPAVRQRVETADILVGSPRHLAYFPDHPAERWPLGDLQDLVSRLQTCLEQSPCPQVVVLTSGDPLFFGLGRLLVTVLPAHVLSFYPHLSSIQLVFSRLKLPWQDACAVSIHGRDWEPLIQALKQGEAKIAVIGDPQYGPGEIATLLSDLSLPCDYQLWIGENLGGPDERVRCFDPASLLPVIATQPVTVDPLHILVLLRQATPSDNRHAPLVGMADRQFKSFPDRPGLMTKREVRVLILAELALHPHQIIWDIGAGTGSVSIEIGRLVPTATIYALEKTAVGITLIRQNCERWATQNVHPIHTTFPAGLDRLPSPDRVFIGGSGGQLAEILTQVSNRLAASGQVVVALATVENLGQLTTWLAIQPGWSVRFLQINLARGVSIGAQHRFSPLNPITLATLQRT
jgi:precorrin-6Y C5,15-methyltransferase (decarboxylating)